MLTSSFTLPVNATPEKIWPYYADMSLRSVWEEDLEAISLEGEFATHTKGVMKLKGMPPLTFTLTHVEENRVFWDETIVAGLGTICFGHEIIVVNNQTCIRQTVTFRSEKGKIEQKDIEFYKKLISDTPDALFLIKRAVEK